MPTRKKIDVNIKIDRKITVCYKQAAKDLGVSFNKWVQMSLTASYISQSISKFEITKGSNFKNN